MLDGSALASVNEGQHQDSADQDFPEVRWTNWCIGCLQDQIELNHLQRDSNAPIDVPVHDGAAVDSDPILAHVHVVNCSHEGDQSSNMEGCPPMTVDGRSFGIEKDRGSNHGDGDDPEGHGREVTFAQEGLLGLIHRE